MENLTTIAGPARKNTVAREAHASALSVAQKWCGPRSAPAYAQRLMSGARRSEKQTGEGRRTTVVARRRWQL